MPDLDPFHSGRQRQEKAINESAIYLRFGAEIIMKSALSERKMLLFDPFHSGRLI